MNLKKMALIGTLTVTTVALLAGCGGQQKQQAASKLPDKIVIGLDDNFPPMGFRDESGKLVGFDIELATEAAKRMGVQVEFKPIDWDSKEAALKSKKVDMLWNGLTITEDRKKQIAYSKPYMHNEQILIVRKDAPIQTKADLAGKILGTQEGSSSVDALDKDANFKGSLKDVKMYGDFVAALMDLEVGRIDGVLIDSVVGRYNMEKKADKFRVLEGSMGDEEFGVGMRKEDTALADKLNEVLKAMSADGTMAKLSDKWFKKDITIKVE
jgi:polar amino acid transport system substrate-binding protein